MEITIIILVTIIIVENIILMRRKFLKICKRFIRHIKHDDNIKYDTDLKNLPTEFFISLIDDDDLREQLEREYKEKKKQQS